ncbi:MAG: 5'-methylthioadenosine/adenosylhomocysteine nucleosidase [Atopobiaceae bacterium]|nr:5'-methylthioadenosine/adenosylhomocysteine nucleosidase [Atopobiaceae bacterium]
MRFGIIGAMQEEVELLREHMENVEVDKFGKFRCVTGTLAGKDVVVSFCGMGKVAAASMAQMFINRYNVTHLIFTGVAGSLDASIDIGDLVISKDCVQHDLDATGLGWQPGQLPDYNPPIIAIEADEQLCSLAQIAGRKAAPDVGIHVGRIATGDQFVESQEVKTAIVNQFGALCCEMEGAAVAQVAWLNDVAFVVVRAISDKADGSGEADFRTFLPASARRCASLVEEMLKLM